MPIAALYMFVVKREFSFPKRICVHTLIKLQLWMFQKLPFLSIFWCGLLVTIEVLSANTLRNGKSSTERLGQRLAKKIEVFDCSFGNTLIFDRSLHHLRWPDYQDESNYTSLNEIQKTMAIRKTKKTAPCSLNIIGLTSSEVATAFNQDSWVVLIQKEWKSIQVTNNWQKGAFDRTRWKNENVMKRWSNLYLISKWYFNENLWLQNSLSVGQCSIVSNTSKNKWIILPKIVREDSKKCHPRSNVLNRNFSL